MTESHFELLADDVFTLGVWDEDWHSYSSCHLLVRGDPVNFTDC
ncbi:hypothetical protein [Deinococcus aerolatus]|nr:hypothetical protein [Deinococcus aerolatus]